MQTMTKRCYLHVGLPKTGTSYLQGIFNHSRTELAAQGLDLLPESRRGTRYVTLATRGHLDPEIDPPSAFSALRRLTSKAAKAPGDRALFSHEVLGDSSPAELQRLVDAFPGYQPHIIITVRDQAGAVVSAWQQHTKGRGVTPLDEFVHGFIEGDDSSPARESRHVLDRVLGTCLEVVDPERIHVVTVPRRDAGPTLLLERFCSVLTVDPTLLRTDAPSENTSLGVVQAELMRRVNIALGERLPHLRAGYREQAARFLARQVLRPQGGRTAKLPIETRTWFERAAESTMARLRDSGVDVVGDLEDLRPSESAFADEPQPVRDAELVDAAAAALADFLVDRAARSSEVSDLEEQVRRLEDRVAAQDRQIADLAPTASRSTAPSS